MPLYSLAHHNGTVPRWIIKVLQKLLNWIIFMAITKHVLFQHQQQNRKNSNSSRSDKNKAVSSNQTPQITCTDRCLQILREVKHTQAFMRAFIHRHVVPDSERGGANIGVDEGFHPQTGCSGSWERWSKHRRLWGLSSTDRLFWILREVEQTDVYDGFCPQTGCSRSW